MLWFAITFFCLLHCKRKELKIAKRKIYASKRGTVVERERENSLKSREQRESPEMAKHIFFSSLNPPFFEFGEGYEKKKGERDNYTHTQLPISCCKFLLQNESILCFFCISLFHSVFFSYSCTHFGGNKFFKTSKTKYVSHFH